MRMAAMMEVIVVLISTLVRAKVCSLLLWTWTLWFSMVRAGCTIHMLETMWTNFSSNSATLDGMKIRRRIQWAKVGRVRSKKAFIGERVGVRPRERRAIGTFLVVKGGGWFPPPPPGSYVKQWEAAYCIRRSGKSLNLN